MVGRWPSSAPVTLAPDADDPTLASANDFTYQYGDEFGLRCPIGAHVRRAHPRDSLDPHPGTADSVSLDKRHRLLRRGREYGPPVDDALGPARPTIRSAACISSAWRPISPASSSSSRHSWINNPRFNGLYDEPDPLVANHTAGGAAFALPAEPVRERLNDLPSFVTTRGGGYFSSRAFEPCATWPRLGG